MTEEKKLRYQELILEYVKTSNDQVLSDCQTYSNEAVEENVSPEEIVQIHLDIIKRERDLTKDQVVKSFDVLLEIIIGYGFTYRDYKKLLTKLKSMIKKWM
ncbi:serine phosphatase RsbU regulator of sigma subunit [Staphylococcus aureus]|nr:serine phosphatase RsbU regulator of sigma subunit [Staphylococcus aureus]